MTKQPGSLCEVPSSPDRDTVVSRQTPASAAGVPNAVAGAVTARPRNSGGFNDGPVVVAGVMVAGGILAAGFGLAKIVLDDDGSVVDALRVDHGAVTEAARPAPPAQPDDGTVTLPDENGNGIADALEPGARNEASPGPTEPVTEPVVYVIGPGDTLAEISSETRVPLDILVQLNDIQNPNLIYAGASLLLAPSP